MHKPGHPFEERHFLKRRELESFSEAEFEKSGFKNLKIPKKATLI